MQARLVRPWLHLLVERSPVRPAWLGAGMALCVGGVVFGLHRLLRPDATMLYVEPSRIAILSLLVPYIVLSSAFAARATAGDLERLRPLARQAPEVFDALVHSLAHAPRWGIVSATAVGILVSLLHAGRLATIVPMGGVEFGVYVLCNGLAWVVLWPALYLGLRSSLAFRTLGRDGLQVDLARPETLRPFSAFGLRSALMLLAGAPFFFVPIAFAKVNTAAWIANLVLFVPVALAAIAALVLPSTGLRSNIRAAKKAELARVDAAIDGDRAALGDSPLAKDASALSLVDLLVWRDRVATLSEWPFDAGAMRRFGLYMLIPLGSWVGGALVEREVDRVVGGP